MLLNAIYKIEFRIPPLYYPESQIYKAKKSLQQNSHAYIVDLPS